MTDDVMPDPFVIVSFERGSGEWMAHGRVGELSISMAGTTEADARDRCARLLASAARDGLLGEIAAVLAVAS